MYEIKVCVTGRVQLVMYRDFAERNAKKRGVTGWVKNKDDGSVSVLAQGEKPVLEAYIERLRKGPPLARVDDVSVVWGSISEPFATFEIVY